MALYVVEHDLRNIPAEQLRLDQKELASACTRLRTQGKHIRYVSSVVVPTEGRAFDLFGAASRELIEEAHAVAHVHYARIIEILDVTPNFLSRSTSRARRTAAILGARERSADTMTANSPSELARWLGEGQRFFGLCLEMLENTERVQSENGMLREEIARLRQRVDVLQADRSEMVAAFNDLAGHVTQIVDHILEKSGNGESAQ